MTKKTLLDISRDGGYGRSGEKGGGEKNKTCGTEQAKPLRGFYRESYREDEGYMFTEEGRRERG